MAQSCLSKFARAEPPRLACAGPLIKGGGGSWHVAFQSGREISHAKFRDLRKFLAHQRYTLWTLAGGDTLNPRGSATFPTAKFTTANLIWRKISPPPVLARAGSPKGTTKPRPRGTSGRWGTPETPPCRRCSVQASFRGPASFADPLRASFFRRSCASQCRTLDVRGGKTRRHVAANKGILV